MLRKTSHLQSHVLPISVLQTFNNIANCMLNMYFNSSMLNILPIAK